MESCLCEGKKATVICPGFYELKIKATVTLIIQTINYLKIS